MAYLSQKLPIRLRTIFMVYHMVYHDFLYVLLISNKEVHYIICYKQTLSIYIIYISIMLLLNIRVVT
jgi:hypothetical protein